MSFEWVLIVLSAVASTYLFINYIPSPSSSYREQKWMELSQEYWHAKKTCQYNENQLKSMSEKIDALSEESDQYWE